MDAATAAANRKRKRTEHGCIHAANDVLVEELKKIRGKIRESSHLAGNYGRAIYSIQNHPDPITSAQEAKQLRNIGNYLANQIQAILQKRQTGNTAGSTSASKKSTGKAPQTHNQPRPTAPEQPARPPSASTQPQRQPSTVSSERTQQTEANREKRRLYVPAHGKQPWFLLRALHDVKAVCEASALATNLLLVKMQMAGYEGDLARLRACIAPLLHSHQVITKAQSGGLYLTTRGVKSAEVCMLGEDTEQDTRPPPLEPSAPAPSTISTRHEDYSRPAVATTRNPVIAPTTGYIELSDSDSDPGSDAEAIRATSLSPPSQHVWDADEPEPESQSSSMHRPISTTADDLVRDDDEWEVVLILDHREVLSRRNRDILERKLLECDVTCEVRSLNVGDVQWIARRYRGHETVDELMLNVIVERKAVNDLSISIIDRRYNEQKTRLRDSGMTHVIYLVEGSLTQPTAVRTSGLQTALCRTQIQNQFFVQQCQSADESVAFLRGVHMSLLDKLPAQARCRNAERSLRASGSALLRTKAPATVDDWRRQFCQPIRSYTAFNAEFRKKNDFSVGEIYQMMLMQVHGLSSAKTAAISSAYPTFHHLLKALERRERVDELRYGESQRRIGVKPIEQLKYLLQALDYEQDTPSVATRGDREEGD